MKKIILSIFPLISIIASAQVDSLKMYVEYYSLDNGLEVVLQPDSAFKNVSVEFWLKDGTNIDTPDQYGLQHYFEHVMPYSPMDSIEANRFFDEYLKGSNAQVKKDFSRFYLKVLPEGLELALERASGRLKAGPKRITEKRVERERERVLNEINRNAKNPHWSAEGSLAIYEGTFGKAHPYAANGYGTIKNNKQFTVQELRKRYNDIVYANNVILFVVGNFDVTKAKSMIDEYFRDIPSRKKTTSISSSGSHQSKFMKMNAPHNKDTLNTVVFSWQIPKYGSPDSPSLELVAALLNKKLNEDNFLASSVVNSVSYHDLLKYSGHFYIRVQYHNASDYNTIEAKVLAQIKRIIDGDITNAELLDAKKSVINDMIDIQKQLGFGNSRTELLGKSLLFTGNTNTYFTSLKKQQNLKIGQLKNVSEKWLTKMPYKLLFMRN